MISSDNSEPPAMRTDYVHSEERLQADVLAAIQETSALDDAIRRLSAQGYGALLVCRGLKGRTEEEPKALKRRVVRVINELIADQEKTSKD